MSFDTLPSKASLKPKPFTTHVSEEELESFRELLKLSRIGPKTYENLNANVKDFTDWGISRQWLQEAKQHWETKYDWRKTEERINSYPNFTVPIEDGGSELQIHFMALFSNKSDAVPLVLSHGWPGSVLEFLGTLDILREKYKPETLPFHVIVPSLPGYAWSDVPLDRNFDTEGIARVVDKLMVGLGFGEGYIAQGGDIVHLAIGIQQPEGMPLSDLNEAEQKGLERYNNFNTMGNAYAREHGTRPATIGLVLSSSPIALLAWVGEKFLAWSDESPPLDEILDSVTLYWFTSSFPRAIYPYRQFFGPKPTFFHPDAQWYVKKPLGYSWHPQELAPVPEKWVAKSGNLVWYRGHQEGGHFAAMEKPQLFVKDMEDFVSEVWPKAR